MEMHSYLSFKDAIVSLLSTGSPNACSGKEIALELVRY